MEVFFLPLALLLLATPVVAIVALVWAARLDRRVRDLELERVTQAIKVPPPSQTPVHPPAPVPSAEAPPPSVPVPPAIPSAARPRGDVSPVGGSPRASGDAGFELLVGTRWLNVAGIVTLLFGVAFFLKYAYDNAWVGPRGRVAIGVSAGLASVLAAEAIRRRGHRVFSQGLTGGGLGAMFLSFFFAFRFYSLLEALPAFVLMASVTACGVALALLQDSLAVAVLAFLGAYLTPVLLSTGQDAAGFLFAYLTVLALGALSVTWFKRWRVLDLLAFAGTGLLYAGWYGAHYSPARFGVALTGLAVFFFIFLLIPYGHNLARRVVATPGDHALALANAAFTFGHLYRMIYAISPMRLGFFALGLSACYLALCALVRRRLPEDRAMALSILGISITFLTLAIPLQLGLHGITLAWAAQGLLLVHLGFRYKAPFTRGAGLVVLLLSAVRLLARHTPLHTAPFTFAINPTFGVWIFVLAAVFAAAWLYRRGSSDVKQMEQVVAPMAMVAGVAMLLFCLHSETWLYAILWEWTPDARACSVMILWALYPLAWILVGQRLSERVLVLAGTALLAASCLPLFAMVARAASNPHPLFATLVFWTGMLGVGAFFAAAWRLRRPNRPNVAGFDVGRFLPAPGTALLLILLTAEVHGHYAYLPGTPEEMASNGVRALAAISVLWALFASGLMALGFARSNRPARYASFGLFGLTLAKVFLMDMAELRAIHRIVSFLILGLLLVVASFFYSRFRSRIAMVAAAVALAWLSSGSAFAAADHPEWRYMRDITGVAQAPGQGGLAWVALDGPVLAESRPDLADLRIVDQSGREVPYVISPRRGGLRDIEQPARLLNRVTLPGNGSRVELEFDAPGTRNILRVETPGVSFRRRVVVEGGDGRDWVMLVPQAWIHRVPASLQQQAALLDEVALPDNDYRRLRISVFAMPEEASPPSIARVGARRRVSVPAETEPLRATLLSASDPNARTTTLDMDFGFDNARPLQVAVQFDETAYRREYQAYARASERMRIRRGRSEDGEALENEIETPWRPIASGVFLRKSGGKPEASQPASETITLPGEPARLLRVVTHDEDNQPLRATGVSAQGLVHRLVFPVREGGSYRLYYGNAEAARPAYDLASLLPDLDTSPPPKAGLGPVADNPSRAAARIKPLTERYPWLLWVVLLTAVALLGAVVLRNLRGIRSA